MKPLKEKEVRVVPNEIDDSPTLVSALMVSALNICTWEGAVTDALMIKDLKSDGNDSGGGLSFFDALSSCAKDGDLMMSIGSTFASKLPDIAVISEESDSDEFPSDSGEEEDWFDAMQDDLDD